MIAAVNKDKLYCIGPMTAEKYKKRLDRTLVDRGLVSSRRRAQELLRDGKVVVNGERIFKNSFPVKEEDEVKLKEGESEWVSRGALKLKKALEEWDIDVRDKKCLDVGACTGGFSQVFLHQGAAKVYALDVGRGQLAEELRADERVVSVEGINARNIPEEAIPEKPDLAGIDVSYISLTLVLPEVAELLKADGDIIALIKPQFEVGRKNVKKGIVSDPEKHKEAVEKIKENGSEIGLKELGVTESPITGSKGNKEFLIHFKKKSV